jgi:hypothetical protein
MQLRRRCMVYSRPMNSRFASRTSTRCACRFRVVDTDQTHHTNLSAFFGSRLLHTWGTPYFCSSTTLRPAGSATDYELCVENN